MLCSFILEIYLNRLNMSNLTKLKFRVQSCASEDSDFPVTELLKHGPQSKG